MKKTIYIVSILAVLFTSCDQDNRKETAYKAADSLKEDQTSSDHKPTEEIPFSKSMIDLVEILKHDNYEVKITEEQKDLTFKKEQEPDKTITFPESQLKTIFVKRKNKIEHIKDTNWYPSFSVTEISLPNEMIALANHRKISGIIKSGDIYNEKNYDYILLNGNKLIYVKCGAKIYEEYALGYKERIEEIIKSNEK